MPFAGVVVNRVHTGRADGAAGAELEKLVGAELAGKVAAAAEAEAGLAERDRRNLRELAPQARAASR